MIDLQENVGNIQVKLSEIDQRLTGFKAISFNQLIDEYEDLKIELQELKDEYEDLKQDLEENYRPIPVSEQYGVSDKDFVEVL